jgi:uncharacterized protein YkwD
VPPALLLGELLAALLIAQPVSPLSASTLSKAETSAVSEASSRGVARLGMEYSVALPPSTATPMPTPTAAPTATAVPPSPSPRPPTPVPAAPAPRQPVAQATPVSAPPPVAPPPTAAPSTPGDVCAAQVEAIVNQVRLENGLSALSPNSSLTSSAQQYADFIAANDVVSHTADGRTLDERDEAAGYGDWIAVGENVAGGYATPAEAMAAWLASPGHKANILNPAYRETGVGCAWNAASAYGYFYVEEFGTR